MKIVTWNCQGSFRTKAEYMADDAAAPATVNPALVTLRAYGDWAWHAALISENAVEEIKALPTSQPVPKMLPAEAIDAILRAVRSEKDEGIRLRDKGLQALLIYAGLRAQEACDMQLRDLGLDGGIVTVRHGKVGRNPVRIGKPSASRR
jgi:site-specific recombinase XerD